MLARKVRPVPSLIVVLAALLTLTACSSKKAPDTAAPPGYTVVKNDSAGFALAIPADWIQITLTQDLDKFDKLAHAQQATNDNLGPAVLQARQLAQSGGKLMAVSPDGKSSVNLTADKSKEKTLDQIATAVTKGLTDNGASDLTQNRASTGAGEALQLIFKYPVQTGADNPVVSAEVQYYLLKGGKSYVLTFINPPSAELPSAVVATFKLR